MRNMLLALAALAVLTVSSSVSADDQTSILQDGIEAAAPAAPAQPIVDAQPQAENHVYADAQSTPESYAEPQTMVHEGQQPAAVQYESAPAPVYYHHHHHVVKKKQTVLGKLIELERKKNAWLRRTFFGK